MEPVPPKRLIRVHSVKNSSPVRVARRRTTSSQAAFDEEPLFCGHMRLASTCGECRFLSLSRDSGVSLRSGSVASSLDEQPIVVTWPSATSLNSPARFTQSAMTVAQSGPNAAVVEEFSDDDAIDSEFFEFADNFQDVGQPVPNSDWILVTKNVSLPLELSTSASSNSSSTTPTPPVNSSPRSSAPPRFAQPLVASKPLPSPAVASQPARAIVAKPANCKNSLAEWTFPIVVGTLILSSLFGVGLEVGVSLSAMVIYLFKQHASPLLAKYLR